LCRLLSELKQNINGLTKFGNIDHKVNTGYERYNPVSRATERHSYAFLPFGGGPRLCIGNQFALLEMMALLGQLLTTFDLTSVDTIPVQPSPLITLRSKQPIRLYVRNLPV